MLEMGLFLGPIIQNSLTFYWQDYLLYKIEEILDDTFINPKDKQTDFNANMNYY